MTTSDNKLCRHVIHILYDYICEFKNEHTTVLFNLYDLLKQLYAIIVNVGAHFIQSLIIFKIPLAMPLWYTSQETWAPNLGVIM